MRPLGGQTEASSATNSVCSSAFTFALALSHFRLNSWLAVNGAARLKVFNIQRNI